MKNEGPTSKIALNENSIVLFADQGETAKIIDARESAGNYQACTGFAAGVLGLIQDQPKSMTELVRELSKKYSGGSNQIEKELQKVIEKFRSADVIK